MIINSPDGQPQYKLSAPKYWLYHHEQKSEFDLPNIIIYNDNSSEIYVTSNKGETYDENNIITLVGDVKIKQPSTHGELYPLNIFTDKLIVSQSQQKITTKSPVTATRGSQKVTALGMTLNLSNKVLYLHNNVKGHYVQ